MQLDSSSWTVAIYVCDLASPREIRDNAHQKESYKASKESCEGLRTTGDTVKF